MCEGAAASNENFYVAIKLNQVEMSLFIRTIKQFRLAECVEASGVLKCVSVFFKDAELSL